MSQTILLLFELLFLFKFRVKIIFIKDAFKNLAARDDAKKKMKEPKKT